MSAFVDSGSDMWRDYTAHYGVITASVMCRRYLDLQARTTDESEWEFCRELREAMAMERNFKDEPYYKASFEYARGNGEETLFYNSETVNILCASEIDDAIRACEYGDGSHKPEPAAQALLDRYGAERLSFVLALEVRRHENEFSAENRAWSQGFDIQSGFASTGVRTCRDVLDEFITCLRDITGREKNMEVNSMSDNKMIRFITSDYKELFQIPDGGSIKITYPPGDGRGTVTRQCKFLDEYHTRVGSETLHICQFAEIMERLGAKYEPEVQLRGVVLVPYKPGDEKFYTYNREEGNTCAGHISGDFGQNGDRFNSGWYNHITRSERDWSGTSPELQAELHSAVYALRQDLLMDFDHMQSYCERHPEARLDGGDIYQRYGFKLETDTRQYYVSCFLGENVRDARFIIYAYDNALAREQERPAFGLVQQAAADEREKFYRNDTDKSCVGYLRGDYGKNGMEFHHSWFDSVNERNTPEFKSEFQTVMDTLRQDVLKDRKTTQDYCYNHPEAQLPGDIHRYGFKLETESRQYFVRCTVLSEDYFYVFAYDKAAAREQERSAVDKPSVLQQIRDAEKAPKKPRKAKTTEKKKDGAEH